MFLLAKEVAMTHENFNEVHQRQSDGWVKNSLIATVITVITGTIGFGIQVTNLTRIYEKRQTTVEVKLANIETQIVELKKGIENGYYPPTK